MNVYEESLKLHKQLKGKVSVDSKVEIKTKADLSLAYTPGVAEACKRIAGNKDDVYEYTAKGNLVAVITDGSAVLGLGNIGPEASLPVMEGKAVLFKEFAGINAFPIALNTQNTEEIIKAVKYLAPVFGGINLEDISAPRCFEIEKRLQQELDIPVFHDDQHGTAIVVAAALTNALKLIKKEAGQVNVVVNGSGAAGVAIAKMLVSLGVKKLVILDSKGIIWRGRGDLNKVKEELLEITNPESTSGNLADALQGADVFIGVSKGNLIQPEWVRTMNEKPIIFALANPDPEIPYQLAKDGGAYIIATGRSDYPNQVNNVLAFPGVFKGALSVRAKSITVEMEKSAVKALAEYVKDLSPERIIPDPLDKGVVTAVADAVRRAAPSIP